MDAQSEITESYEQQTKLSFIRQIKEEKGRSRSKVYGDGDPGTSGPSLTRR